MCGIAGWVTAGAVDEAVLRRMTDVIAHRGPDAEGFYLSPDKRVGLGFRRLSIIDLTGGNQPMSNEDGTVWVVFNGEIYNFPELRSDLEGKGHRFATHSDTESIIHAYEEYGEECVARFNGMFAFAVWDQRSQRLFLARDRFGKKPLHYARVGSEFVFGSEIKSLLAHPSIRRTLDRRSLARYLAYEYVPAPNSIFSDIKKLPPAHRMTYDLRSGQLKISRYWDLKFRPDPHCDEREAEEQLVQRLREAVRCRLVSDVPLGVFLSGGIDSSTLVAFMTELMPANQVKTFNIAFTDQSFDESPYARQVAAWFGTDHREQAFDVRQMVEVLPDVMGFLDEPMADASLLPTYLLSQFTRQHVTVALGGDGGDELFAGYPNYAAARYAAWYEKVPAPVRWCVERLANQLPAATSNFSFDFKLRQFLKGIPWHDPARTQVWLGSFSPPELGRLLSDETKAELAGFNPLDDLDQLMSGYDGPADDWLDRLVYQHVHTYLTDDILVKVDRASMACSLEVRAPFLDYKFAEFLGTLPPALKLRGASAKHLLKKAMASRLPKPVVQRPKKGFGIPLAQWFKNELSSLAREKLAPDRLRRQGLFNPAFVQSLLDEHQQGRRNHRKPLWTLLVFQLWAERSGL